MMLLPSDSVQFDASRRGEKMLNYYRDKNESAYRSGKGGDDPLCDPGSELYYWEGGRE